MENMSRILMPKEVFDQMTGHCRSVYPNEACGILAGRGSQVSRFFRMQNVESSPVSYLMDSKEQFEVMKALREDRLSIVALFHSHPASAAYPSAKDVALAFYEDSAYVIVSLSEREPMVKAFFITNGVVEEVEIEVGE